MTAKEIWIDFGVYELARRGSGKSKQLILKLFVDHVKSGLAPPPELLEAVAAIAVEMMPKVKNDLGFHEASRRAYDDALAVQRHFRSGDSITLNQAYLIVAKETNQSDKTITKHYQKFVKWVSKDEIPPIEEFGDF